jgi:hypothetical protein
VIGTLPHSTALTTRRKEFAVIIAAMLLAGPLSGWFCRTTRQAVIVLLAAFALVLAVQSVVVATSSGDGLPLAYWAVQAAALAGGLALLWLGIRLRDRKARTR